MTGRYFLSFLFLCRPDVSSFPFFIFMSVRPVHKKEKIKKIKSGQSAISFPLLFCVHTSMDDRGNGALCAVFDSSMMCVTQNKRKGRIFSFSFSGDRPNSINIPLTFGPDRKREIEKIKYLILEVSAGRHTKCGTLSPGQWPPHGCSTSNTVLLSFFFSLLGPNHSSLSLYLLCESWAL